MATVSDPLLFAEQPDPYDAVDFAMNVGALLEAGETVDPTSITVAVAPEYAALGATIATDAARAPGLDASGQAIVFWPLIADANQADPTWDNAGCEVEIDVRFATLATPPHRFSRGCVVTFRRRG